jgi:isobutyryl-CoA dehydrogenase
MLPFAAKWDAEQIFPVDTLREAAKLGFGGINVAEEFGGTGLGRLDSSVIYEALATSCTSTTAYVSIHNMCAGMINKYGTEEQKRAWLPAMCAMESLGSYCLTEPNAGSDAGALSLRAERRGDEFVLTGSKAFVSGAGASGLYLVMSRTGG